MAFMTFALGLTSPISRSSTLVTRRGAGGALLAAAGLSLLPRSTAFAADAPAAKWAGRYSDPSHPTGFRELSVQGKKLTIVGRDAPDAAKWTLSATVSDSSATIDFSPKGGPKDLPATLSANGESLVFPDVRRTRLPASRTPASRSVASPLSHSNPRIAAGCGSGTALCARTIVSPAPLETHGARPSPRRATPGPRSRRGSAATRTPTTRPASETSPSPVTR